MRNEFATKKTVRIAHLGAQQPALRVRTLRIWKCAPRRALRTGAQRLFIIRLN